MAQTTLTLHDVERLILASRMRQLHAEQHGTQTSAETYRQRADYWLDLWPAAHTDRAVRI